MGWNCKKFTKLKGKKQLTQQIKPELPKKLCLNFKILYNEGFKKSIDGKDPDQYFNQMFQKASQVFKFPGLKSNVQINLIEKPQFVSDPTALKWSKKRSRDKAIYKPYIRIDENVHHFSFFTASKRSRTVSGKAWVGSNCLLMEGKGLNRLSGPLVPEA